MEWSITLSVIALFGGLMAFAGWKSGQPRKDSLKPLWISWTSVTVLAMIVVVFAAIHALNMLGVHTGSRTLGKYGSLSPVGSPANLPPLDPFAPRL